MVINCIHTNSILNEIKTDGHSPLLVLGSDYKMYVAKNDKGKTPPFSILNECISAYFLDKWNITAPKFTLITIAKELLVKQDNLSQNHKTIYYDVPCFGSKFIDNPVDVNSLLISNKKKVFNTLINPIAIFHITLFDTWVENDDRKPSNYNLILEPKEKKFIILPIDNAFIFSTQSYEHLDPKYLAVSDNDHLLVSPFGYLIKKHTTIDKDFINNERDYFYLCIKRCEQNFDDFIIQLRIYYTVNDASIKNLKKFLFNNKIITKYCYRRFCCNRDAFI
jgi:hypothetical protein